MRNTVNESLTPAENRRGIIDSSVYLSHILATHKIRELPVICESFPGKRLFDTLGLFTYKKYLKGTCRLDYLQLDSPRDLSCVGRIPKDRQKRFHRRVIEQWTKTKADMTTFQYEAIKLKVKELVPPRDAYIMNSLEYDARATWALKFIPQEGRIRSLDDILVILSTAFDRQLNFTKDIAHPTFMKIVQKLNLRQLDEEEAYRGGYSLGCNYFWGKSCKELLTV